MKGIKVYIDPKIEEEFRKTAMKIVLVAGMGHKGEWSIPIEDFEERNDKGPTPSDHKKTTGAKPVGAVEFKSPAGQKPSPLYCFDTKELQHIVEKALDKKLKPVITKLNRSLEPDPGPSLSDIFGGIGYILGLVGVGAYFNYRSKKRGMS